MSRAPEGPSLQARGSRVEDAQDMPQRAARRPRALAASAALLASAAALAAAAAPAGAEEARHARSPPPLPGGGPPPRRLRASPREPAARGPRSPRTGCSNWAVAQHGEVTVEADPDACGRRCDAEEACVGFGYQHTGSPDPRYGWPEPGACALWWAPCERLDSPYWDDYGTKGASGEAPPGAADDHGAAAAGGAPAAAVLPAAPPAAPPATPPRPAGAADDHGAAAAGGAPAAAVLPAAPPAAPAAAPPRRPSPAGAADDQPAAAAAGGAPSAVAGREAQPLQLGNLSIENMDLETLEDHPEVFEGIVSSMKRDLALKLGVKPEDVTLDFSEQ